MNNIWSRRRFKLGLAAALTISLGAVGCAVNQPEFAEETRPMKKLRGFTRNFWVANVIELFERFAYYGSKAILAVFVADQVGLGPEKAGWLVGSLFNGLLYFLPVLAGNVVGGLLAVGLGVGLAWLVSGERPPSG